MRDRWRASRLNVDVISCLEIDPEKGTAFPKVRKCVRAIIKLCREEKYPFQGLCVDSFTSLATSAMRYVQGASGRVGKNPTQPEWGLAFIELKGLMVLMRSLPISVIFTAHEFQLEQEDGVGRSIEIAIPGRKLPSEVTSSFDEVWRYRIRGSGQKREFLIQTQGTSAVLARSRFDLKDNINVSRVSMVEVMRRCGYDWHEGEGDVDVKEEKKKIRREIEEKSKEKKS